MSLSPRLFRRSWDTEAGTPHRLYVEEGLPLKLRRRRRPAGTERLHFAHVTAVNQRWAMNFMHDVLLTGAKVCVFTCIDVWRECVALRVIPTFTGSGVARILAEVRGERGTRSR